MDMELAWSGLLDNWARLGGYDIFRLISLLLLIALVTTGNKLFVDFIAAKPPGRKTALGDNMCQELRTQEKTSQCWCYNSIDQMYQDFR